MADSDQLALLAAERVFGGDTAYTPDAVVDQHLTFLEAVAAPGWWPREILTPTAGAGAWTRGCRRRWPNASITAIEINPGERGNLERVADVVVIADALAWARAWRTDSMPFDLVVDNPPWSNFGEWAEALLPLVDPTGYLQLYGPTQWGQAKATIPVVERCTPVAVGLTGGRVRHHPGSKTDALETCSRIWRPGRAQGAGPLRRCWETFQLDHPESTERRL